MAPESCSRAVGAARQSPWNRHFNGMRGAPASSDAGAVRLLADAAARLTARAGRCGLRRARTLAAAEEGASASRLASALVAFVPEAAGEKLLALLRQLTLLVAGLLEELPKL